ncbi:MAG TPA: autotransporter-associated beta strand repeat-containing protein, partial [Chthoniobacteraceae bacterium]|nr:autotransporter-associated beta strand repeat-containing protein [Chthoniobacteraceae bacterium]
LNINGSLTIGAGTTLNLSTVTGGPVTAGSYRLANYTTTATTPVGVFDTVSFGGAATLTNVTANSENLTFAGQPATIHGFLLNNDTVAKGIFLDTYGFAQPAGIPASADFGFVHTGVTASQPVSITNNGAANPFTEGLAAAQGTSTQGSGIGFTSTGSIPAPGVAGGATDNTNIAITLNTSTPGQTSGASQVYNLTSIAVPGSGFGNTALPGATVNVTGTVYSGQGVLATAGGSWGATGSAAATGTFTTDGNVLAGNFSNAAQPGVDGAASVNDTATLGAILGANTLSLNGANPQLSGLTFSGGTTGTLAQGSGGTLTLRNNSSAVNPTVTVSGNSAPTISAPITLANNANVNTVAAGDSLTVSSVISGTGTGITKSGAGSLVFTGANNYTGSTVVNAGTLQVGNGTTGTLGSGPVTNNATLRFNRSNALTVANTIGGSGTLNQTGASTLTLNGAVTGQAVHAFTGSTIELGTGDTTPANPNHSLAALTVDNGATVKLTLGGTELVKASALSIGATGRLDITKNTFVLDYAGAVDVPAQTAAFRALVQLGFNGGNWDGAGGIGTSTVADGIASGPGYQYLTGIGYMSGALTSGSFLGRAVDAGSVIARYTYYGDANLDGVVNGQDYTLIDTGFAAQNNVGFVYGWVNGDFNYDGHIDGADYALIDTAAAFSNGQPISFTDPAPAPADGPSEPLLSGLPAETASLPTAVPEPVSFGFLALGGAILGLGRRRKKGNVTLK